MTQMSEADIILPEYRVTLGAELFVTAKSAVEAHMIAMSEVADDIFADEKTYTIGTVQNINRLFTVVTIEKLADDDEDDDEDEDDAPDDMPRKPKRPAKMRK